MPTGQAAAGGQSEKLTQARQAMKWANDQRLTTVILNEDNFRRFALGAHEIGISLPEQVHFCLSQWCYKNHLEQRLQNYKVEPNSHHTCDQFFELFEELGWERKDGMKTKNEITTHDIWRRIRDYANGYGWLTEYDARRACGIRGNDRLSQQKEKLYKQSIVEGLVLREQKNIGRGYRVRALDTAR